MADNSALVPETLMLDAEPIRETEEKAIAQANQQDEALASLVNMTGWDILTRDMREDIAAFKTGGFIKEVEKLSLEEVGKLFVIHQTVATFLQKYLDKVETAAKAVADAKRVN